MSARLMLLFEQLPDLLGGHLTLAVPAIFIGVLISLPLGVLCVKCVRIRGPVMSMVSLVQTVIVLSTLFCIVCSLVVCVREIFGDHILLAYSSYGSVNVLYVHSSVSFVFPIWWW